MELILELRRFCKDFRHPRLACCRGKPLRSSEDFRGDDHESGVPPGIAYIGGSSSLALGKMGFVRCDFEKKSQIITIIFTT